MRTYTAAYKAIIGPNEQVEPDGEEATARRANSEGIKISVWCTTTRPPSLEGLGSWRNKLSSPRESEKKKNIVADAQKKGDLFQEHGHDRI
jgi:hypothetical protein